VTDISIFVHFALLHNFDAPWIFIKISIYIPTAFLIIKQLKFLTSATNLTGYEPKAALSLSEQQGQTVCIHRECDDEQQVTKTVWDQLGVELSALDYFLNEVQTQQKSTTIYAALSHTPTKVEDWEQFDLLIDTEKTKPENREQVRSNISHLIAKAPNHFNKVLQEEDVTQNACTVLNYAKDLLKVSFIPGNKFVKAYTDIIAMTASMENHSISDSPNLWSASASGSLRWTVARFASAFATFALRTACTFCLFNLRNNS